MNQEPRNPGKYAILTAASNNIWVDCKAFLYSLRQHCHYPLYIVNLNLDDEQVKFLNSQESVYVLPFSLDCPTHLLRNRWQWYKPYYFDQLPTDIDYALWIDIDTIILKSLGPLFAAANERFFVIQDYFAPESCKNTPEVYEKYPAPVAPQHEDLVLNSGVIGFSLKRDEDRFIIKQWQEFTNILHSDAIVSPGVSLFDQGALLWVLRKHDKLDCILNNMTWNCPAKRNPYDLFEDSYKWQSDNVTCMGGDIFDNVKYDNPNAIIAHYAGVPKFSNLLKVNDPTAVGNLRNKRGREIVPKRVFVVGLERAGTHTFVEALRKSSLVDCWIRHEYNPLLAVEAYKKFHQEPWAPANLYKRLAMYARNDCEIVCEANHRLSFFVPEIYRALGGQCEFVLLLRDPIALIRSKLLIFSTWLDNLTEYPGCYQHDMYHARPIIDQVRSQFNKYRIKPPTDLDIIGRHIWEICATLDVLFTDIAKTKTDLTILWLDKLSTQTSLIAKLFPRMLNKTILGKQLQIKYGAYQKLHSNETIQWIDELLASNQDRIIQSVYPVLMRHGCVVPSLL